MAGADAFCLCASQCDTSFPQFLSQLSGHISGLHYQPPAIQREYRDVLQPLSSNIDRRYHLMHRYAQRANNKWHKPGDQYP